MDFASTINIYQSFIDFFHEYVEPYGVQCLLRIDKLARLKKAY